MFTDDTLKGRIALTTSGGGGSSGLDITTRGQFLSEGLPSRMEEWRKRSSYGRATAKSAGRGASSGPRAPLHW